MVWFVCVQVNCKDKWRQVGVLTVIGTNGHQG